MESDGSYSECFASGLKVANGGCARFWYVILLMIELKQVNVYRN